MNEKLPSFVEITDPERVVIKHDTSISVNISDPSANPAELPQYQNVGSVVPQEVGSVKTQVTSFTRKGNFLFVSYSSSGLEVAGGVDIIDISNVDHPVLKNSYSSSDYQISDLKIKDSTLFLTGSAKADNSKNAVLMILDVSDTSNPYMQKVINLSGTFGRSIDLKDDMVLVTTGPNGGLYKYDISNPTNPLLVSSDVVSNALYSTLGSSFSYSLAGENKTSFNSSTQKFLSGSRDISSSSSDAPSRFYRQNSIAYVNNSRKLSVLDLSQSLMGQVTELSNISLSGKSQAITKYQQTLYAAQGEKGLFIIDASNPASLNLLGNLTFNGSSGNVNNVLVEKIQGRVVIFIADATEGLKILSQSYIPKTPSSEISFYARSQDYQGSAVVNVTVNGSTVSSVTLSGTEFNLYKVNYSREITSTDTVDLVFANDKYDGSTSTDRNAMIAYLKVNNHYCYVGSTKTLDDLGLMNSQQSLSVTGSDCSMKTITQFCAPGTEKPSESCSLPNNKVGKYVCNDQGTDYSCVDSAKCETGYALINNQCVIQVCSPSSTKSCSETNGLGTQTCSSNGTTYGYCEITSCDSGFFLNNGVCSPQACSPNAMKSCSLSDHFEGIQVCNSSGSEWGSCTSTGTCSSGYNYSNGECVVQACAPSSSISCSESNGSGTKTCDSTGSAYGSCQLTSCSSGYYLSGGSCVAQSCTPNSTQSCVENHLIGSKTCNSQGSSYGSCETNTTCESGYYYSNGSCVVQSCTPNATVSCSENNGSGTKTCNSQGSSYGSCTINACNSGYNLQSGNCVANTCSPNSTSSCSSGNGTGTQTCNSQGSSYGSCTINACNSGYYLSGGSCVAQTCSPNSTASCSVTNGTGTQTCNSQGSSYGSCAATSCNSGYVLSGGSCVADVNSCSITNGTGQLTNGNSSISFTQTLNGDWGSGYSYQVVIANNQSSSLNDWAICFSFNYNVGNDGISNASIDSSSSKPNWKLVPMSYNKTIYPGSSVSIGWNGSSGGLGSNRLQNIRILNKSTDSCSSTPAWSSTPYCEVKTCNSGYHVSGNTCVSN